MSGIVDQVDKGLAGLSPTSQLINIQPQGPLPYTSYDLLKHWSGIIGLIKFVAHAFSLPLMVFLRRDFGMRYVDEVHIALSFIIWQVVGLVPFGDNILAKATSPLASAIGWIFLLAALYHRRKAKKAALAQSNYSYYPGMPLLATVTLSFLGWYFRFLDRLLQKHTNLGAIPRILTHPGDDFSPEMIQGLVRRFVEPPLVLALGLLVAQLGISDGLGAFLAWIAILLYVDESISQRTQWELYLDAVDAQVIAEEKQRLLSGDNSLGGKSNPHGFSLASIASLRDLSSKLQNAERTEEDKSEEAGDTHASAE